MTIEEAREQIQAEVEPFTARGWAPLPPLSDDVNEPIRFVCLRRRKWTVEQGRSSRPATSEEIAWTMEQWAKDLVAESQSTSIKTP